MHFHLTDEQQALSDMVQRFLAQEYAFEARRKILRSPGGWSREIWGKLGEMGLLGLQVPEEQGGMAPATVETLVTLGAMGRALLVEPYLSSAVLGTALVRGLGTPAQREALLPGMATGERIAVVAHGEAGARHDLSRVATQARRAGAGGSSRGGRRWCSTPRPPTCSSSPPAPPASSTPRTDSRSSWSRPGHPG